MTRPGTRLRSLAARVLDSSTLERLIDPVIADLQHEHEAAIRRGLVWRGRWIRLAGYCAFWKVAAIGISRATSRALIAPHDGAIGRTIRFSGLATTALTLIFMWPAVWNSLSHPGHRLALFLALVPQALSVALPMGIVFGVFCGLRGRVVTARVRMTIVGLTIVSSLAMIVFVGWILPVSNQVFREVMFGGPVAPGTNELTIVELWHAAQDRIVIPVITGRYAFEFHFRLALGFAPLALGLFSLGMATAKRSASGILTVNAFALVSCLAYYTLLHYARLTYYARLDIRDHSLAIVAAWGPDLAFLAMASVFIRGPLVTRTQEPYR
jgi:hypothetical protein